MNDVIVVALVAVWMFFMFRRGGCCGGGHGHRDHQDRSSGNKSCCHEVEEDKNGRDKNKSRREF